MANPGMTRAEPHPSDSVLPSQYWTGQGWHSVQPEKRLMAAVLEEAVSLLVRISAKNRETREAATEAAEWFANDSRRHPFSFASICDVLGLEADSVRTAVVRLQNDGSEFVRPRMSAGRGRHKIRQRRPRSRSAA